MSRKIWVGKIVGQKKIGWEIFLTKKNVVGNFLGPKIVWSKNFLAQNFCRSDIFFTQKNLVGNFVASEKFGRKFFWVKKNLGQKKIG